MASRSPSSSPDSATGSGTDPARPDTGEPLGGGSDSDSDLGLGKFDCGVDDPGHRLEGEELEHEFEAAADRLRDLVQTASREQLLYLYARYKQVKVGKCNTAKPGFFDFEGQRKWTAWKQLEDMSAEQAMQEYVSCVTSLDPDSSQKERRDRRTGFGGPAVSSLYQEEMIREEDKNIFDYCRENNIEHITTAISSKKVDVNAKDEEDDEGQTALHYASACEFADIVELLLQAGADPSMKDQEGSLPEEVTESSTISSLLRQYTAPKG
ncbi:acyl-CoA-binding domain-containing protein 6 isoform X2 [Salmo salar]|uniref:Acyl-CoA-binding domain-containing protein 6 n=1 Tax=Salmo salar TaxID=8030 RepID=A0A1S3T6F5_SALSA|nr:acyl-CoA-binding domain-containing protein 6 isoform X2 [Salmo salar]XP_029563169.1 acyl-CoA-binding domain-containing protein 6 isoform X2 [Salmo trutta]|eukprot:XP_014072171.1 PREDICTED: acyl-CoA-binding domain-containing protein 6 isoform X2 [Salmo salar]